MNALLNTPIVCIRLFMGGASSHVFHVYFLVVNLANERQTAVRWVYNRQTYIKMPHNTTSPSFLGRLSARSSFISPKDVKVTVQLLNDSDSSISNEFKRSQPAQMILDYICELKNIREKDYLGLRYQDHNKHRYWVDLSRPISHISKQFKSDSLALRLRFRYYPAEPSHLKESVTRYHLFMQLQRDLLHGRLYCPQTQSAELAALILQAQLGDYDELYHKDSYVSQYKLLLKQTPRLEEKIAEYHKLLRGKSTEVAELEFLEKASKLDTYGFDPYTVKDPKDPNCAVYFGVSYKGILIYHSNQKVHHISWAYLSKVDYIGKEMWVVPMEAYIPPTANGDLNESGGSEKMDRKSRTVLKYICPSGHFAKHLWTHILSQQAFFNEQSAIMIKPKFSKPRIPLLSRGSTFRYPSQRVLKEIESSDISVDGEARVNGPNFIRFELPRQEPRQEQPWLNKYNTLPNLKLNHSCSNNDSIQKKLHGMDSNNSKGKTRNYLYAKTYFHHKLSVLTESQVTAVEFNPSQTVYSDSQFASSFLESDDLINASDEHQSETVTSFTVRLVKYEHRQAFSVRYIPFIMPEPKSLNHSSALSENTPGVPLLTSTPIFNREDKNIINGKVHQNGNGSVQTSPTILSVTSKSKGRMANIFFSTFLVMLLLIALLIAVFERSSDSDWVEGLPWLSHIRHAYYEPVRHYTLNKYYKFASR
uniref:FERM domain-containing protein n=1 Tax=Heterorhabditis bacteriophora TaxID=37862 RepID=A0A1I7XMV6_HETBA